MAERTTVRLPEELLNRARRKAAAENRTLTSLIEDGLRLVTAEMRKDTKAKRVLPRISKADGGPMPGIDPGDPVNCVGVSLATRPDEERVKKYFP